MNKKGELLLGVTAGVISVGVVIIPIMVFISAIVGLMLPENVSPAIDRQLRELVETIEEVDETGNSLRFVFSPADLSKPVFLFYKDPGRDEVSLIIRQDVSGYEFSDYYIGVDESQIPISSVSTSWNSNRFSSCTLQTGCLCSWEYATTRASAMADLDHLISSIELSNDGMCVNTFIPIYFESYEEISSEGMRYDNFGFIQKNILIPHTVELLITKESSPDRGEYILISNKRT